jgi:hypothetical protein
VQDQRAWEQIVGSDDMTPDATESAIKEAVEALLRENVSTFTIVLGIAMVPVGMSCSPCSCAGGRPLRQQRRRGPPSCDLTRTAEATTDSGGRLVGI